MSRPVEGWDQMAQDWWDGCNAATKASALREVADRCVGNVKAHLLAAAATIEAGVKP